MTIRPPLYRMGLGVLRFLHVPSSSLGIRPTSNTESNVRVVEREHRRCIISEQKKDWVNIIFLTLTPIIGIAGTAAWTITHGLHLWMPLLLVTMYLLVGISICAGYHRFFSHQSYEASRVVQIFYAIFGAMAAQNSILWWSSSHRVHHKHV